MFLTMVTAPFQLPTHSNRTTGPSAFSTLRPRRRSPNQPRRGGGRVGNATRHPIDRGDVRSGDARRPPPTGQPPADEWGDVPPDGAIPIRMPPAPNRARRLCVFHASSTAPVPNQPRRGGRRVGNATRPQLNGAMFVQTVPLALCIRRPPAVEWGDVRSGRSLDPATSVNVGRTRIGRCSSRRLPNVSATTCCQTELGDVLNAPDASRGPLPHTSRPCPFTHIRPRRSTRCAPPAGWRRVCWR